MQNVAGSLSFGLLLIPYHFSFITTSKIKLVHLRKYSIMSALFVWLHVLVFLFLRHVINTLFSQGANVEPGLMRCCHVPCGSSPADYVVNISNKLALDIRYYIKKYYSVSIS